MTESAAPVASEAPTEAAPAVVEQAPAEPKGPRQPDEIVRDSKARLQARLDAGQEARDKQADGQPRVPEGTSEGGQFKAKEGEQEAAPSSEGAPAAEGGQVPDPEPAATGTEGALESEPANVPAELKKVLVGEGHPLRDRGREHFDVPADQEMDLRAALNSHTRRAEVAQAQQQLVEINAQLAESRADAEYWMARAQSGGVLSAEQTARYQDILNTYGEADAEAYRQGVVKAEGTDDLDQRRAEAKEAHQGEVAHQQAVQFATSAISDALQGNPNIGVPPQYPHWTEPEVRNVLSGYGSLCDARGEDPTPSGWYAYANAAYEGHPRVQAERSQAAAQSALDAKKTADAEAQKREAASMKDAATRHATRPGNVPATVSTGGIDHGTPDQQEAERAMSPTQRKRAIGRRIREFGGRAR